MRIAWVVPGGVDRTGVERVIPLLLDAMRRLAPRHELHVFVLRQEPEPATWPLLGCIVHNLGGPTGRDRLPRFDRLAAELGRFDVVHGFWLGECADLALRLRRRSGSPVLLTVAGGELAWVPEIGYGGSRSWRSRWVYRRQMRAADRVSSASQHIDQMIRPYGVEPVRWVPGVDTATFRPPADRVTGPPWRLLHVASINRVKGPYEILEAMRRIVEVEPEATLQWIGYDTLDGAIQAKAEELGLGDAVTFTLWQPSEVVREAMQEAHLLLMASYHEAGPVVTLEAAAGGVPTVGTAVGSLPELHPECGLGVPVGQAEALAEATVGLLRDPDRREAMGQAARAWAVQHDADRSTARLDELYRGLAERGR